MWLDGQFNVLSEFSREKDAGTCESGSDIQSPFDELKARYNLTAWNPTTSSKLASIPWILSCSWHELKELFEG